MEAAGKSLVDEFRSRRTLRAGSLITTVFGDAIAPRGGSVWLGSLIAAMKDFGISERLVRTSVYRLAQDGWLQATQIGRRSYYSLTDEGAERFAQATHRIYGEPAGSWDGRWCLVLVTGVDGALRDNLRKELGWLGFGPLAPGVLAHPAPDTRDLEVTLRRLGVADAVVVMRGRTIRNDAGMRRLAHAGWNLEDIDARYARFVERFRPLIAGNGRPADLSPRTAFLVRTLLIQEYRKILLRDPQLPAELLPAGWHGASAYQLCRNLYRVVFAKADEHLSATIETAGGPLPLPESSFMERFGGLT